MDECCREGLGVLLKVRAGVGELLASQLSQEKIGDFMARVMKDVNADLDLLKSEILEYVAKRDAADAEKDAVNKELQAQVQAAVEQHVTDQAALDALQPEIDAAFQKAEEARAEINPPAPPSTDPKPPGDSSGDQAEGGGQGSGDGAADQSGTGGASAAVGDGESGTSR